MLNQVAAYMTSNTICVHPNETARRAYQIMMEQGFHHLPVVENKKVLGIVSERDLLPYLKVDGNGEITLNEVALKTIVTKNATAIEPFASILDAAQMMLRYAIDALTVIDFKGEFIGIITSRDILSGGNLQKQSGAKETYLRVPPSHYDGSDARQQTPFYIFQTYQNDF